METNNLHLQKLRQKNCVKVGENVYLLGKKLDCHDMSDREVQILSQYRYKGINYKAYSRASKKELYNSVFIK